MGLPAPVHHLRPPQINLYRPVQSSPAVHGDGWMGQNELPSGLFDKNPDGLEPSPAATTWHKVLMDRPHRRCVSSGKHPQFAMSPVVSPGFVSARQTHRKPRGDAKIDHRFAGTPFPSLLKHLLKGAGVVCPGVRRPAAASAAREHQALQEADPRLAEGNSCQSMYQTRTNSSRTAPITLGTRHS